MLTREVARSPARMNGPAADRVDVSLVIVTRNRAAQLKTCLAYVAAIKAACRWELIVVDNGSTDDTASVIAACLSDGSVAATTIYEGIPGKSLGLNKAWRAARGDIVAFTDDDCYVAPDYIDKVSAAFGDPRVGFAGGRIDLFDPADYPITIRTDPDPVLIAPRSFIPAGELNGANIMFRRRVLEEIGGFDPDLGPGARFYGEEMDAQARASFAGWWGLYLPDAVVAHHHRRKERDVQALLRIYALARGAYMAKFLLSRTTRMTFVRGWYWSFRSALRAARQGRREFVWQLEGAGGYLAYRLGRRTGLVKGRAAPGDVATNIVSTR